MEEILKSIGWDELYPETMNRLNFFKDGFRDYFSEDEISNKELEDCVAYAFGIYGQGEVYSIYMVIMNDADGMKNLNGFVNAFKEALPKNELKAKHYIDLFMEFLYSCVIKKCSISNYKWTKEIVKNKTT